jgi:hypothetical protein
VDQLVGPIEIFGQHIFTISNPFGLLYIMQDSKFWQRLTLHCKQERIGIQAGRQHVAFAMVKCVLERAHIPACAEETGEEGGEITSHTSKQASTRLNGSQEPTSTTRTCRTTVPELQQETRTNGFFKPMQPNATIAVSLE